MKKKLEAELISIAHRVLKLKGREDVMKLHQEAQKITEALAVLKFYEEHKALVSLEIPEEDFNQKLTTLVQEPVQNERFETEVNESIVEVHNHLDTQNQTDDLPTLKLDADEDLSKIEAEPTSQNEQVVLETETMTETAVKIETETPKETPKAKQISLEDFLMNDYVEPEFIKVENVAKEVEKVMDVVFEKIDDILSKTIDEVEKEDIVAESNEEISEDLAVEETVETTHEETLIEEVAAQNAPEIDEVHEIVKEEVAEETVSEEIVSEEIVEETEVVEETTIEQPQFSKTVETISHKEETFSMQGNQVSYQKQETIAEKVAYKTLSLNDRLNKGISIGLNDRIAFVKNLFAGSNEDYNRVMSQLNTIDNYPETLNFIENMVKPDYNQWAGKEEYAERFMQAVEKKFL
jgi:hypothetical protein